MGEYVKYQGNEVKIGTAESLYYVSYPKYIEALNAGKLSKVEHNSYPPTYAKPEEGFLYRFPFPDEDHLSFGDITGEYNRFLPFEMASTAIKGLDQVTIPGEDGLLHLGLRYQKLTADENGVGIALIPVYQDLVSGNLFSTPRQNDAKIMSSALLAYPESKGLDNQAKHLYNITAARLLAGFNMNLDMGRIRKNSVPPKRRIRNRKGL